MELDGSNDSTVVALRGRDITSDGSLEMLTLDARERSVVNGLAPRVVKSESSSAAWNSHDPNRWRRELHRAFERTIQTFKYYLNVMKRQFYLDL